MTRVRYEIPLPQPVYPNISNEAPTSFCNQFINALSKGMVVSNADTVCCPPCGLYAIGNIAKLTGVIDKLPQEIMDNCCLNVYAGAQEYSDFLNTISGTWPTPQSCSSNLLECADAVKSSLGQSCCDGLATEGIVELGTLGPEEGVSQLCTLLSYLQSITPAMSPDQICTCLQSIMTEGIVVKCLDDGNLFIGSVNIYLDTIA
jgi:hypothetical protein